MRLLTFDPGKDNFAYCLFEDGHVLDHGFINTLKDLSEKGFNQERRTFANQVEDFLDKCELKPEKDKIVLERFMHRPGMGKGGVGEVVNQMIGIITTKADDRNIDSYVVTAASWKNHMKRKYDMPKKGMIELLPVKMTAHEADAIGIACYTYEKENDPCVKSLKIMSKHEQVEKQNKPVGRSRRVKAKSSKK